jgi:hypothetical protein
MVVGAGLLALVLSVIFWPALRFAITIAHEGGHAVTGSVMGGRVDFIHIYRTGGGLTHVLDVGPVGGFLFVLAGYLGPSAFGLVGALLLAEDRPDLVLWLSVLFLLLALFQAGNFWGMLTMIITGAIIFMIVRNASPGGQTFFAYTWIWFLLFGGFGHVLVLQNIRKQGPDTRSDVHQLRKMTFLPASLWSGIFWLLTLAALIYGAGILLEIVRIGG